MNHYGAMAWEHWRRARPQELAELTDPKRFFTQLGEQIQTQIRRRRQAQESTLESTDSYLTNLGLLNNVQSSVEDEVLREMIFTDPETTS
ncbi:hypothetical protein [Saccharomonospora azurea]|uniref:Uncharacterized protein n=1 Tax=Saccharomonospora azurea NA-128 TaxID=882081 RepID=H8G9A7_9PSEU|nr:hypothetical protein [Saccharomonospora azurea]EHY87492.1 hypothetical protein SacazDRAFT_00534 [Saccharomonospora azurea NA-128]